MSRRLRAVGRGVFDFRFDTTVALRNVLLLCHIGTAFLRTVILVLQWSTFELQGADIFFDDKDKSFNKPVKREATH